MMDEMRKRAYRYLLYRAMLEIRPMAWMPLGILRRMNPILWHRSATRIRRAGDIADWLHNLASFSAHEFEGFDEEWFWREYDRLNEGNPDYRLPEFKWVFENTLAGQTGPPFG